jgi:FtsH-binding integral membrane protein
MRFDIRLPIGLLFTLVGVLLAGFGAYAGSSVAAGSRGLNVNLWWGLAMLVFGLVMLALARRHARRSSNAT